MQHFGFDIGISSRRLGLQCQLFYVWFSAQEGNEKVHCAWYAVCCFYWWDGI